MNNFSIKTKQMKTDEKKSYEEKSDKYLREALQRAVNTEKAPESLRERISRMIREN